MPRESVTFHAGQVRLKCRRDQRKLLVERPDVKVFRRFERDVGRATVERSMGLCRYRGRVLGIAPAVTSR